jgi:xylene monooxygenase electron transfer component|tara:strand:- start:11 stop:316 length:306 start_codon:yes stop_codon:yes gene_type:complete
MFNIFKKKDLKFNVRLEPSNKEIVLKAGENLLTVALAQGIKWPHKCRVGSCGTCKCKVLEGEVKPEIDFGNVLSLEQIESGYVLACKSSIKTDLKILIDLK